MSEAILFFMARGERVWFPTPRPRKIAGLGLTGAAASRGVVALSMWAALARDHTWAGRSFFPRSDDIG